MGWHNFLADEGNKSLQQRRRRIADLDEMISRHGLAGYISAKALYRQMKSESIRINQVEKAVLLPLVAKHAVNGVVPRKARVFYTIGKAIEGMFMLAVTVLMAIGLYYLLKAFAS